MHCWFRLSSGPPTGVAALGVVDLYGDIEWLLARLGVRPVAIGTAGLRRVPGVDTLVVARPGPAHALLFPHAGRAVGRRVLEALLALGVSERRGAPGDPRAWYPEAATLYEAWQLAALARARSPMAIDLLLDQPRRWALVEAGDLATLDGEDARILRRLIDPPVVALLGAPNIGKSSLVNALAGRDVSIVADLPGTTRDHVGVAVDLGGLVVHLLDTPGLDPGLPGAIDREAQELALGVAARADLVLLCADHASAYPPPPPGLQPDAILRCVGLRADLGPPASGADLLVSARDGAGLGALAAAVRDALVPPDLRTDPRAWPFWDMGS